MSQNKKVYLLGISLGITISLLLVIVFGFINKATLIKETRQLEALNKQIEELNNQNATLLSENNNLNTKIQELQAEEQQKEVVIDINKGMKLSEIADVLIQNKVYPHKKDLMIMLEFVNIKNREYTIALENANVMRYGGDFLWNISSLNKNLSKGTNYLINKGYVEDAEAFNRIVTLENHNKGINYGQKTFKTGMSLDEIAEVLIN